MIYSIEGVLIAKKENFVAVDANGVGYKIFTPKIVVSQMPHLGATVKLFCHLNMRQDALELYGFYSEKELELFERLISVSGVGPKSALGIMGVAKADQLVAAINEGKIELLTRVSGVGKKTAERVVLELKGKLAQIDSAEFINKLESDVELEETLIALGYSKAQAKAAIARIPTGVTAFKDQLREALKNTKNF